MLNHPLRDWYLGALGVVQYIPRDRTEVIDERPLEKEIPAKSAKNLLSDRDEESVKNPIVPVKDDAQSLIKDEFAVEEATTEKADNRDSTQKSAPASTTKNKPDELIQFRLAFWQPSEQLVVLSSMPPGTRPSQSQQDMLSKMLKAIGQLATELPPIELLDWPLSPGTDSSLQGARELLTAFLDVKHHLKPFRNALLMGDIAAGLFAKSAPAVGGRVSFGPDVEGIVTHSLYDMDHDNSLKRDTWEAIRFLSGDNR